MNGLEQIDFHSQDDKESEAMSRRSQDALLRNNTHGGTTNTRHTAMTPRALPLFCLWDVASALDPGPTSPDWRLYCIRMEVPLEEHAGDPPPACSWNDAVVADVVCHIVPKLYKFAWWGLVLPTCFLEGEQLTRAWKGRRLIKLVISWLVLSLGWDVQPACWPVSTLWLKVGRQ